MATVTMTERDFDHLVSAANFAKERGDMEEANALDKIARKLNAALTIEKYRGVRWASGSATKMTWQDVPSTLI